MRIASAPCFLLAVLLVSGCGAESSGGPSDTGGGAARDAAGLPDVAPPGDVAAPGDVAGADAGRADAGRTDVSDAADAGDTPPVDAVVTDTRRPDSASDTSPSDGASDSTPDAPDVPSPECTTDADCAPLVPAGDLCNVATCDPDTGRCDVGPKDCREQPEDDPCTIDVCNPQTGACVHQDNPACFLCAPPGGSDDARCDDLDPCTENRCNADGTACEWVPRTVGCDDGNPCTEGERCGEDTSGLQVAVCGGGDARGCDDGDEATLDWCDPLAEEGCRHLPVDDPALPCGDGVPCPQLPGFPCVRYACDEDAGRCVAEYPAAACSDNDPCTEGDRCADGVCVGGARRDCGDGDPLTVDACVPERGGCVHATQPGRPCATPADCFADGEADDNACLDVLCREGWCVTVDVQGSCEDGLFCTTDDYCEAGRCVSGVPRDCDDGDPTTPDRCDEEEKACVSPPSRACGTGCATGSDCDDGDPCTTDACLTFTVPPTCVCTPREFCACDHRAADGGAGACDDGDATTEGICCVGAGDPHPDCTHTDVCVQAFDPTACDEPCAGVDDDAACADGDPCTFDTCEAIHVDPETGAETFCCQHPPLGPPACGACASDADCSDGDPCTADRCGADGRCEPPGPPVLCECLSDDDCEEDDDPCTTVACSDERACVFRNNVAACDDGDACTWNDVCVEGTCVGEDRVCDDGDPCTADTCDPVAGCVHTRIEPPPEGCDDCRTAIERDPDHCADGNPCTVDVCGEDGVCRYEDRNADAATPRCQPFACSDRVDCDDGNPCTTDQCVPPEADPDPGDDIVPSGACHYVEDPVCETPGALVCEDAAGCHPSDCVADDPFAYCNSPREGCPLAYCDPALGCRFLPTASCVAVECTPATEHVDCFDENPCTADICDPATNACAAPDAERPSVVPGDNLYEGCFACQTFADCPETGAFDITDPCVTATCRLPAVTHPEDAPPTGFCYAHVDQALFPNACEDYDLCTIDACVPDVGCEHASRGPDCVVCTSSAECSDLDPCTIDVCEDLTCSHEPRPDCLSCATAADCPDWGGSFCDDWVCTNALCVPPEDWSDDPFQGPVCVPGVGCTTGGDCAPVPGTIAGCVSGSGDCLILPDPAGAPCESDEMCFGLTPCTSYACVDGACAATPIPGCAPTACAARTDCDDGNGCTIDVCVDGACLFLGGDPFCCETAGDCVHLLEGETPCSVAACTPQNGCRDASFGAIARCGQGCETDEDCRPACGEDQVCDDFCLPNGECYRWDCARTACAAAGYCVWFDGDCLPCDGDGDCVDPDPCTVDACVDGACTHTPDPACAPTACDADTICDSGDPCTLGLCLSGACIWFPNPYCP